MHLGDVVPDHPHMLILMFWLVIIGLSIVSMLLSVIQIKIEEWLYNLMIRMHVLLFSQTQKVRRISLTAKQQRISSTETI